jgi:pyruvate kinase
MAAIPKSDGQEPEMRVGADPELAQLHRDVDALVCDVADEARRQVRLWEGRIERESYRASAHNLACYLAVRRRDLRGLQRQLMVRGLSSLGRMESRVAPTLAAVQWVLGRLAGGSTGDMPSVREMLAGERRLAAARRAVLGSLAPPFVGLLITCPSEAAEDPGFMLGLAHRGVGAVRINCAHDDVEAWGRMIGHLRTAEAATGRRIKVFMDLAGPKIRTASVRHPEPGARLVEGDLLAVTRVGELGTAVIAERHFAAECTLEEALAGAEVGDRVFIDDGKLSARVERLCPWGFIARVTRAEEDGLKLKSERGLNFPDTSLGISALTKKDLEDLAFIAEHADGVEFSFVQAADDVATLQAALEALRPKDWKRISLILKIETARAVAHLPEIIVQAAGRQPAAVMIARGDLAVEIGFARTAEMQEEILWLGEAAGVPVIWATQVLEHLIKKGFPSRGEMTDAAMAARAECVMLNKGPHLFEAIDELQGLLGRMAANQHKKSPQLRKLKSWPALSLGDVDKKVRAAPRSEVSVS